MAWSDQEQSFVSRVTPNSSQLRDYIADYIADATGIIESSLSHCKNSIAFQEIYHLSLSTDTVLKRLVGPSIRPRLMGARSVVRRIPLLVSVGQKSVGVVELRRFVELTFWAIYFTDHSIEWHSFETDASSGFSRDIRKPISYAARRELAHYVEYARELMGSEPSGVGTIAVDGLKQASHELNTSVHAGELATTAVKIVPHEGVSDHDLRGFAKLQRRVFANCCLLLAAFRSSTFHRFDVASRAHFDWLVGPTIRKQIRQGPFGLT